jgi:hypothetical protein
VSDFSTITFEAGFSLIPASARDDSYQSKDFPEQDARSACIDGHIHNDGVFVRHDDIWNPALNGWAALVASFSNYEWSVRFEGGRAVEVRSGRDIAWDANEGIGDSPNAWEIVRC